MREGWKIKTLEQLISFSQIGLVRNNKEQNNEYPFRYFKMHNIRNENGLNEESFSFVKASPEDVDKYSLKQKDFLFNTRNSFELVGKTCIYTSDYKGVTLFNNNILRLNFKDFIIPEFVTYAFSSERVLRDLEKMKSGTTNVVGIYFKSLKHLQIFYPPLQEQKQIVSILDEAFAAIDQAKANIEKNIQNAEELFQSKLNQIFSQKGEGWEERSLGDNSLLKIVDGDRGKNYPKKSDYLKEGFCVFMNTGNVRPNGFDFSDVVFISKEKDDLLRKGKLKRQDIVMTTRGTIGNLGWYDDEVEFDHIRINSGMLIFRVNNSKILPEYLFTLLRSSIVKKQIIEKTSGAAQPQLPIKTLVTFKIPMSSNLDEQKNMVALIQKMELLQNKLVKSYKLKILSLEELKKSILQKAFTGELTHDFIVDELESKMAAEPNAAYNEN
ncbi:restriction endonuclease subunit S [Leeuwenhoekiella sp. W20_SRS_FM14]|uniref:restriction endonuclease subunit S n=1 Tax=Leeuwenhoekiella sp. W20_SRS_FM14 TaxID=3240270 RepID=UPI003F98C0FD